MDKNAQKWQEIYNKFDGRFDDLVTAYVLCRDTLKTADKPLKIWNHAVVVVYKGIVEKVIPAKSFKEGKTILEAIAIEECNSLEDYYHDDDIDISIHEIE